MKIPACIVGLTISLGIFTTPTFAQKKGLVRPSVVASSIEGDWEPSENAQKIIGEAPRIFSSISFRKDEKAVDSFAPKLREAFEKAKFEYFFIGWMSFEEDGKLKDHPFVVTHNNGNLYIFYARDKGKEAFADAEDRLVTIVNGKDRDRDLLFIGYRPGQPFAAFQRVKGKKN